MDKNHKTKTVNILMILHWLLKSDSCSGGPLQRGAPCHGIIGIMVNPPLSTELERTPVGERSCCKQPHWNTCQHVSKTHRAPTVLVSPRPIMSWSWRKRRRHVTWSTCCWSVEASSVQFMSCDQTFNSTRISWLIELLRLMYLETGGQTNCRSVDVKMH